MRKFNNYKKQGLLTALKSCKSLNDFLAQDDLNGMLRDLDNEKPNITDCILIYKTRDGNITWQVTDDILRSTVIYMLESTKFDFLNEG